MTRCRCKREQKKDDPIEGKLERLGITSPRQLAALATQKRGCTYYSPATKGIKAPAIAETQLSNEELSIAQDEGLTPALHHIAKCGEKIEPENKFWKEILTQLGPVRPRRSFIRSESTYGRP